MEYLEFKSNNLPSGISEDINKETDRIEKTIRNKNLQFSEERNNKIGVDLYKKYEIWKKQTSTLRRRLIKLNNMMEGVVSETNYPYEGASNMTLHYAAGMARTFKSVFNKTCYQDPDIFYAESNSKDKLELNKIESVINYSFNSESNGIDTLKNGTFPCFRDGTLIISGSWERRVEMGHDSKTYVNVDDFMVDFPTAQSMGTEEEKYNSIIESFIVNPEIEVRVNFDYDFIDYDGPEYEIVPLSRFVFYPVYAPSIKRMELYGKVYYLSENELKWRAKKGEFYEKSVEDLLNNRGILDKDEWSASKNFIEGLSSGDGDKKPFEIVGGVCKIDMDGDGILEKYLVNFAPIQKKILSLQKYPLKYNIDFCIDFRFIKREDRFLGVSLAEDGKDLFDLMDTIHRHRNNIRTLVASPIMLATKSMKDDLDFGRADNLIRPGTVFWVNDIDKSMRQVPLQNLDQPGNSLDEENLVTRYIELVIGPTQGLSGKESPSDPRAPMGKTLALMNAANMRIDDYMDEFRKSFPDLARLHCALYSQFGPTKAKYSVNKSGSVEWDEIDTSVFSGNKITWKAKRRSVTLSPEFSMQRIGGLIQVYSSLFQLIRTNDTKAIEMWNRMVISSGEPDNSKLLIQQQQSQLPQMQQLQLTNSPEQGIIQGGPTGINQPTSAGPQLPTGGII